MVIFDIVSPLGTGLVRDGSLSLKCASCTCYVMQIWLSIMIFWVDFELAVFINLIFAAFFQSTVIEGSSNVKLDRTS